MQNTIKNQLKQAYNSEHIHIHANNMKSKYVVITKNTKLN